MNILTGVGRAKSEITDAQSNLIGWGNVIKPFSTVSLELDLRSREKEKRTLHFIVDGYQQECYFYNVPESVKVGVCFFYIFDYFLFYLYLLVMYKREGSKG